MSLLAFDISKSCQYEFWTNKLIGIQISHRFWLSKAVVLNFYQLMNSLFQFFNLLFLINWLLKIFCLLTWRVHVKWTARLVAFRAADIRITRGLSIKKKRRLIKKSTLSLVVGWTSKTKQLHRYCRFVSFICPVEKPSHRRAALQRLLTSTLWLFT